MAGNRGKKDSYAGGAALLAAMACLCWKGLQQVEARLKKKSKK